MVGTVICASSLVIGIVAGLPSVGGTPEDLFETDVTVDAAGVTGSYRPVQPCRLTDTRNGTGFSVVDDRTISISVDACGLPPDATAIVATTTIINDPGQGFLVTYPSGTPAPTAATLTWTPFTTRGNSATIQVGADRRIELFRSDGFARGHVAVDVVGAFVPADVAGAGRFVPEPGGRRLLDTRTTVKVEPGGTVTVARPDGVPADAAAIAVNVTALETTGRGYFTAFPTGTERPVASMLNVDGPGQFRSSATIVPLGEVGFELYADVGAHLVVDMTGWFTGDGAEESTEGLFVPVSPVRLADTRPEPRPVHPGGTIEVALPAGLTDGVQSGAPSALAASVTMIDPDVRGYVTVHASRSPRGDTASGYAQAGEIVAQFGISPASDAGIAVFSANGTELTVDLLGWFTGPSTPISLDPPSNPVPVQRVLAIGDSTMAGVERTDATRALQGAAFDFRARSCRRLVRTSCTGLEGPVPPPTALDTLNSIPTDAYDVLVVMAGYNDTMPGFAGDVPVIIAAARDKGIRRIIWPTMAREFRSDKGGPGAYQVYEQHNQVIRANAAAHDFMIAPEWSSIVRQVPWWTYTDGIHLDRPGGFGAADLMSRAVAHVTGQRCPQPETPGGSTVGICPEPGSRPPVDVRSLYGF